MPDTNTKKSLIDMLVAECGLSDREAATLADSMIKNSSAHLILTIRESNEGLTDTQACHLKTIETWFDLIADTVPGIASVDFNGDIRASTVLLVMQSGAHNSFSGKWRVPVQMPATPSTALMRPLRQDIDYLRSAKEKRMQEDCSESVGVIDGLQEHDQAF